jgi:transposase
MRTGRPIPILAISEEERATLQQWTRRPKTAQALALRARIILACACGKTNTEVAAHLKVTKQMVGKWRSRFLEKRLDGLLDEPRPGTPRKMSDTEVERVLTMTLESMPQDATHWSTRALAEASGLSHSSVHRIWRAFGLAPHRTETFKLSKDPLFIDKVRDIVGLYMNPPDKALVLCVDEKPQIQALDRSQPIFPMRPGQVERRTHDYTRNGTTSLFAALDTKTGKVIGQLNRRHRSIEFRKFLDRIDQAVPQEFDVHLILDNYATHKTPTIRRWLIKRPRFHLHFTPTGSSWINLVERWFALITEKQLRRGVFHSTRKLEETIRNYIDTHNAKAKPFIWTKTADEILASIARFCQRTLDTGH